MFHLILHEPEIPPNTGNIIRLCANTGCTLHLVEPLGFALTEPALRRAGLDYHDMARVHTHRNLAACLAAVASSRLWIVETGAPHRYSDVAYRAGDALLFGSETRGLVATALDVLATSRPEAQRVSIPMTPGNRSLNLSNAVSLVVYEAWRQQDFAMSAHLPD
jgi:tRNA (cytidine/uridine-2'-O-)-methyltransferase